MGLEMAWMIALLALWAGLLIAAYTRPAKAGLAERRRRLLLASSAVLTVAAWSTVLLVHNIGIFPFPFLLAVGMTFGFLGDLFMSGALPAPDRMIAGMGSFGIGHIFYVSAAVLMQRLGFAGAGVFFGAWAAWLLIAALGWYLLLVRRQRVTLLHKVALPYSLLLASTAGAGTGLALGAPGFISLAAGGALFLISDMLIALREFNGRREPWLLDAIWITYGPAQALIVYTTWLALL